jgi:hypothetical protein
MQRPGQDVVPKDDVPWWMKYAGRGLGTVGGMGITFIMLIESKTPQVRYGYIYFLYSVNSFGTSD